MSHDPSALIKSFLYWLREREIRQDDSNSVQQFGHVYQQLSALVHQSNHETQNGMLQSLTQVLLSERSNWEFGCIANTCGMIVEHGGTPAIAVEPILDRITKQLERVPELVRIMQENMEVQQPSQVPEQEWPLLGARHPEHAWVIGEWLALRFTGCAAMTMLSRDIVSRQRARQRTDLMLRAEAARGDNPFAYYLADLLGMIDDEQLLVLDVTRKLGFRVRLTAIRNNFHLFTLLQDSLLTHPTAQDWHGPRIQPLIISVAKSERMLSEISPNEWSAENPQNANQIQDQAIWTFSTWQALTAESMKRSLDKGQDQTPFWIWGEMKPTEIPSFQGERVILLGPIEVARSWDIGFFAPLHPALRSSIVIEDKMSEGEYAQWITRIRNTEC